jgi:hypothetical protein
MHAAMVNSPKGQLFYWNLDGAVGKNGVNKFDDVLFVQWCFYKLSKTNPNKQSSLDAEIAKIGVNGECSGRDGDPLVEGIKALQKWANLLVDGRVSPVPNSSGQYVDSTGRGTFLIIYPLNAAVAQMHPAQWPRIDLMPEFVWRIREQALAPFNWG